jgi:non-ribosomal peptide synthetase component F
LEELNIQYADYAAWQRGWLQGDVLEAELSYWREQLADAPAVLELPTDHPRPAAPTMRGALDTFKLAPDLTEGLRALGRSAGVTMFMTTLAAFQVLLARYSRKNDINVGTVIAGRTQGETEGLIGFFVNTLVLRGQLRGNPRFEELLGQVREVCLGAYAHQDVPFEKLVEELQPERKLGHSPLFQVAFGLDNAPKEALELPGLTLDMAGIEHNVARFDLTLWIHETGDELTGIWTYSTDLFEAATIKRMSAHYERLLQGIVARPEARLSAFEIFTEEEKRERELKEQKRAETNAQKLMNVRRRAVSSGADATK